MIRRLYVHDFRCFENFELRLEGQPSWLLIGRNGSGKSAVGDVLKIFQDIGRGASRAGQLVKRKDFSWGRESAPMRFEIEVKIGERILEYRLALDLPEDVREMRVCDEGLSIGGQPIFTRTPGEVTLYRDRQTQWGVDWHSVALPIVQERSPDEPLALFKRWLGRLLVLRPEPRGMAGESIAPTVQPDPSLRDLAAWYRGLVDLSQAAGETISQYLRGPFPDLVDVQNLPVGREARELVLVFDGGRTSRVPLQDLSDGERCQLAGALVVAAMRVGGDVPLTCFWDEPDSHLSMDEVQHFVLSLKRAFREGGQFLMTSHDPEAIASFSRESTLYLSRCGHSEPVVVRPVAEIDYAGDLVGAIARGDLAA